MNGKSNGMKAIDLISNDSIDSKVKDQNENDVDNDMDSDENVEGIVVGPTTRRAWSDWCSSRGKSSKENSEDENTNTSSYITTRNQRKVPFTRGKKKVLRKKSARSKVIIVGPKFNVTLIPYWLRAKG